MLGEGGDGLKWPDHGEARSTVVRPAVRKKGVDSEFPAESSIKDGSTKHTRNQRSYDRFC